MNKTQALTLTQRNYFSLRWASHAGVSLWMTVSMRMNTTGGGYPPASAGSTSSPNFTFQAQQQGSSDCCNSEHKCKGKKALLLIYVQTEKVWPMKPKSMSEINKQAVSDSARPRQHHLKLRSLYRSPPKHLPGLQHWPTADVYRLFFPFPKEKGSVLSPSIHCCTLYSSLPSSWVRHSALGLPKSPTTSHFARAPRLRPLRAKTSNNQEWEVPEELANNFRSSCILLFSNVDSEEKTYESQKMNNLCFNQLDCPRISIIWIVMIQNQNHIFIKTSLVQYSAGSFEKEPHPPPVTIRASLWYIPWIHEPKFCWNLSPFPTYPLTGLF